MVSTRRSGFALLAVLWVMVGLSALALAAALAAREGVAAAQNRVSLTRAAWSAEACLEVVRAEAGGALRDGRDGGAAWRALDRVIAESPAVRDAGCEVTARPAGDAVDANAADGEQLRALFTALGQPPERADSLADALLDWRDADTAARPEGAERTWYDGERRVPPRDAALADVRELSRVRGFDALAGEVSLDAVLTVEPGRVVLDRAPLAVVASLPGMTAEALARVGELRARGERVGDVMALGARLSPAAREALYARYADLVRLVAEETEAWVVTCRARDAAGPAAEVEVRLVRAGERAAVVRRRTRP